MRSRFKKLIVVFATALATTSVGADSCDAGPILDWLFPNRAARRAARNGTVTYRIPVGTQQNQQLSGYAPTTRYRTVWAPVPVTQYRPVSYVNPLSTSGASGLQPCSTYQWQARRVPYTSYQPSVQASTCPVTISSPATTVTPWTSSPSPSCRSCGTTSYYGTAGSGAAPIATEWKTVGSGVSYATPGATGLLSPGTAPATVQAGYPNGQVFSPAPNAVQQQYQAPRTRGSDPMCQSCPAAAPASTLEPSPAETSPSQATPWEPLEDGHRTRITPLPADTDPSLLNGVQPRESGFGETKSSDGDRYYQELRPVTPNDNGPSTQETSQYTPHRYYGTTNSIRRPDISLDDAYRRQGRDRSLQGKDSFSENDSHQGDPYRAAAPSQTPTVPYIKPIPDLKRQQRTGLDVAPIPSQLDDSADRTARRAAVAPQRSGVPINWSQVDIDRQGSIKRVPIRIRPITQQKPSQQVIDDEDEGGWRRAAR